MPPVSLLIKPASSNCNLRCKYCFYHSVAENRSVQSYGMMSLDVLETVVKKALEYADGMCTFAFQGGEPTLAGLGFFEEFIRLVKKYNAGKVKVNYAIQTNGTVIDDKWAAFLAANKFLTGISLDGMKEIHDEFRQAAGGEGTFSRVMDTIGLFDRYGVEYNILTVINSYVARNIKKVYSFFKSKDFRYLQFIPCLDPLGEKPGGHEYSLKPDRYAYFLKSLFDLWYEDYVKGNAISIRYFDNLVGMLMGYPPESCGMSGVCSCYFVLEADGGVYPCDFYVTDEWRLGNIMDTDFRIMIESETAKRFVGVSEHIDPKCRDCRWYALCRGGCRRNREPFIDGEPILNSYCSAYKEFFEYAGERMYRVAKSVKQSILPTH